MSTAIAMEGTLPVARAVRCDPNTWVERHGDVLYRYALLRLRDSQKAEDAVQETFLAALKAQDSFAGQSTERTWLIGILKHKIIDSFRKSSREVPAVFDDEDAQDEEVFRVSGEWIGHWKKDMAPQEWCAGPDALVESQDFWDVFQACLNHMPPRMAQAFTLRELEELDTEEICQVLQITAANFWVLIHRARMHLRRCLETKYFHRS